VFFGRGKIDFFDLNGDGFPDQLNTRKIDDRGIHIIYSNPLGGLLDSIQIDSSSFCLDKTRTRTSGLRLAGTPDITNDIASKVKANNTRNTETNIPVPRRERVLNLTLQYAQYQLFTRTLFAKSTR